MPKPTHVMIDLETMGVTPQAPVVAIGAVVFDPRYNLITEDTFYQELDWKAQDRPPDESTVSWWRNQPEKAKKALHGKVSLEDALFDLEMFLPKDCKVWGNGSIFDIAILEDAYRQLGMVVPWSFWNIRDCRTIKDLFDSSRGGTGTDILGGTPTHHALEDAIRQAKGINKIWKVVLGK